MEIPGATTAAHQMTVGGTELTTMAGQIFFS